MPNGLPDLPQLTGASLAALMPPPAITELLARMSMPPQLPQTPDPLTVEQILPFTQGRAKELFPITTPPYVPPTPEKGPSLLAGIVSALQRGVSAGLTQDPGAALLRMSEQDQALKEQKRGEELLRQRRVEDLRYQEQQRQKELGVQLAMQESSQQRQDRQEEEKEKRLDERDRRNFYQQLEVVEKNQKFTISENDKDRLYREAKEQRIQEENAKKLKLEEQRQRNQLTQSYVREKVKDKDIIKELVDFDMGLITQLSPKAARAYAATGRPAGGGGQGGAETGRALVDILDAGGNVLGRMPYSQVKFSSDTGEIQGFPGSTIRFVQPQTPAGAMSIEQKVEALKSQGVPSESIIQAIRVDAPQRVDELIKKYGLKTSSPPTPGTTSQKGIGETLRILGKGIGKFIPSTSPGGGSSGAATGEGGRMQ